MAGGFHKITTEQAKVGLRALVVAGVFAIAVTWSVEAGTPDELPDVALGWDVLFHVLRTGALLGGAGIVLLVGWRAIHGEFPIKFGNVEYAAQDAAAAAEAATKAQEQRIRVLEVLAEIRPLEDLAADQDDP